MVKPHARLCLQLPGLMTENDWKQSVRLQKCGGGTLKYQYLPDFLARRRSTELFDGPGIESDHAHVENHAATLSLTKAREDIATAGRNPLNHFGDSSTSRLYSPSAQPFAPARDIFDAINAHDRRDDE